MKSKKIERAIFKVKHAKTKSVEVIKNEGFFVFAYKAMRFTKKKITKRVFLKNINDQNNEEAKEAYKKKWKNVTIIIPSFNDYKVLKKCLQSIKSSTNPEKVKVLIVDDASTDEKHKEFLKEINEKNIEVIYKKTNGGFAKTINEGLKRKSTDDIILLNSDTEAKAEWLEALQFAAYQRKDIGIVGPKLLYPDGSIQFGGSHRNTGAPEWFDHYYRFKESDFPPANTPNYVIGVTGACMYIKREVVNKIGLLDEGFPMAFEDMDYCLRAWNEGYRSYYYPMATLIHHESITRGKTQNDREKESLRYFWEKWGKWFDERNVVNEKGKIKIIYVLQSTGVGGGHRMVFEHVNRLKDLGFDVKLYALEGQPAWFPLKVKVKKFTNYEKLISALEKEDAIKVATWWETSEPVWLSSVNRGIPVYYVQDIESSYYKDDQYMQQVVLSKYKKEFKYLTISGWNRERLLEMDIDPLVIGCGIDSKTFKPTKEKRKDNVLMAVGRSHYLKNLQMTLDAWKKIKNNQPTLWMFGIEPQLTDNLKNAKYFFKPSDEEVNSLLNKSTVFAQTSRHEGFCLPVVEAMAAGSVVITTNSHGNADFCEDGKNCLMVKQDDVDELKVTIEKLFSDKKLQEKLRKEGYKTAKEYDWPVVEKKIENFYKDLGTLEVLKKSKTREG